MTTQESTSNIIKSYPELTAFEVEYNGNKFNCNACRNGGKCCGVENNEFAQQLQCMKCRCQQLYGVSDESRKESVSKNIVCDDCNNNVLTKETCENYNYLKNNLNYNLTDCSNNLINVGANSKIEDVTLRSKCSTGADETAGVIEISDDEKSDSVNPDYILYGGIGVGVLIFIILIMILIN